MAEVPEQLFTITSPGLLVCGRPMLSQSSIDILFHRESVVCLSSGAFHSIAVCASGRAYAFRWVPDSNETMEPTLVKALELIKITDAACGYDFTLFLSDEGKVFSGGNNDYGQLGLRNSAKISILNLVPELPPIRKCAAGSGHVAVLSFDGQVWVCGRNDYGQLGLGHNCNVNTFTVVTTISEVIIDVSCGSYTTVLLTASQHLLVAGKNEEYQLGVALIKQSLIFLLMSFPPVAISAVVCGYNHSVALAVDGTVWAWGDNTSGQLGVGNGVKGLLPQEVPGLHCHEIASIFAGCNNTGLVTKNGDLLVCGRGQSGQLGPISQDVFVPVLLQKSPDLVCHQMAFADNYSLMSLTKKIEVSPSGSGMETKVSTLGFVTNEERCLMSCLECPVCQKVMCTPIHLCIIGHSICGDCYSLPVTNTCPVCQNEFLQGKNVVLERLYAELRLPCTDCLDRMPVAQLKDHSRVCPDRSYKCPMLQDCAWNGRIEAILAHAMSAHHSDTWCDLPHLFSHTMAQRYVHVNLLTAHDGVFVLYRNYSEVSKEAHFIVRLIGRPENANKYRFQLDLNAESDDFVITVRKKVCSDIQTLEEILRNHKSISVNREMVEIYLQNDDLLCKVSILKVTE